ncbi:hypothetical protein [Streptomyces sp. CMB-StM0423]|uniref:hypothetical protein n=1 Tax=Streptomyces sp. CMB-StM0423 TaxID=2059884 RepID=UPI001F455281|nr:hypothetical protein [Streptomyces sp. CMB-StM0423]
MSVSRGGAVHRLVVSADIKGSGRLGHRARLRARQGMYEVFEAAFAAVGVGGDRVHLEDRGDGVLAALAPEVPPAALVGLWLEEVHQGVREHNEGLSEPLRLRIAMHGGPVGDDGRGLVGRAVDLACRLCDSEPAKAILAADDDVHVVFVASDVLYHSVVAEGGRFVEPEHYRPIPVRAKETDEVAWFHVPRRAAPPWPAAAPPEQPAPTAAPGGRPGQAPGAKYWINVNGHNQIVDGAEVHGDIVGVRVTRERDGGAEGAERGE